MEDGDFKAGVVRQPGSAALVHDVSRNVSAIGYAGVSFVTDSMAVVPLATDPK